MADPSHAEILGELIAAATAGRDLLRHISLGRKKFGPIATAAQSRAWALSAALGRLAAMPDIGDGEKDHAN